MHTSKILIENADKSRISSVPIASGFTHSHIHTFAHSTLYIATRTLCIPLSQRPRRLQSGRHRTAHVHRSVRVHYLKIQHSHFEHSHFEHSHIHTFTHSHIHKFTNSTFTKHLKIEIPTAICLASKPVIQPRNTPIFHFIQNKKQISNRWKNENTTSFYHPFF